MFQASKIFRYFTLIFTLFCLFLYASVIQAANLYPGEEIRMGDGYPALVKFVKGDPSKPTIVFVPGALSLARAAYGTPESNEQDFLAYWVNKKGYSFLAISYPLDNPVYENTFPDFSIQNWGKQDAEITKQLLEENDLNKNVILMGWSMGGMVPQSYNVAAKNLGINVEFYI